MGVVGNVSVAERAVSVVDCPSVVGTVSSPEVLTALLEVVRGVLVNVLVAELVDCFVDCSSVFGLDVLLNVLKDGVTKVLNSVTAVVVSSVNGSVVVSTAIERKKNTLMTMTCTRELNV